MKTCYKCKGRIHAHDSHELQKRFSNGAQEYLCGVCTDIANDAIRKSREVYGIEAKAWKYVMRRFRRQHDIPLYGPINALQAELCEQKRKALLRLMFWMDIRSVKEALENHDPLEKFYNERIYAEGAPMFNELTWHEKKQVKDTLAFAMYQLNLEAKKLGIALKALLPSGLL